MKRVTARIHWVFLPKMISCHGNLLVGKTAESETAPCPDCYGFESLPDSPNKFQTEKLKTAFTMLRLVDVLTELLRSKPEDKLVSRGDWGMTVLKGQNNSLDSLEVPICNS